MSERVQLPPGCGGFRCADGTVYKAKPGTSVVLDDRHATALKSSQHQAIGLVRAGETFGFAGTGKPGRWCADCHREWFPWSVQCPACGAETAGMLQESDDAPASTQSTPDTEIRAA